MRFVDGFVWGQFMLKRARVEAKLGAYCNDLREAVLA